MNTKTVDIIGAGLSGCEAALQLAARGVHVNLYEMRPLRSTPVHTGGGCAELVCSNSLKSTKPDSAAGMLKHELSALGSQLSAAAYKCSVPAGGALAVDREAFSATVGSLVAANPLITKVVGEVVALGPEGQVCYVGEDEVRHEAKQADAVMFASGPLTSDLLAQYVLSLTGSDHLAFYDAAAPIVMADSLDMSILFRQSRYEDNGAGDYLNAPFTREEYESFIRELLNADRVILVPRLRLQLWQGDAAAAHHRFPGTQQHISADGADVEIGPQHVPSLVSVADSVSGQQFHDRNPQGLAQRLDQRNIRQSLGSLPLGYRFVADADLIGQLRLGQALSFSQTFDCSTSNVIVQRISLLSPPVYPKHDAGATYAAWNPHKTKVPSPKWTGDTFAWLRITQRSR